MREERLIKPSDVERVTRSVSNAKQNSDFYVSHSTLADIEAGSVPSIHKLFSLALSLNVPLNELLLTFGIDSEGATDYEADSRQDALQLKALAGSEPPSRFQVNFDTNFRARKTTLLRLQPKDLVSFPLVLQGRFDPVRYRYALIGIHDDTMADLLPPRSLVEIDVAQNTVEVFSWRTIRDRPVYLVWHSEGHTCCWCQVDCKDLTLVSHPLSRQLVRRFKMPKEATVVGRVTNAWLPFGSVQVQYETAS